MIKNVHIGHIETGRNKPVFFVAEIGINHNGSLEIAKRLIDVAKEVGCSAVKFQKRTPELCVPDKQKNVMRETPWGIMTYLEYRNKIEFGYEAYQEISEHCLKKGILWFASCWDENSVDFLSRFDPVCYKVPSALLTNHSLIKYIRSKGKPVILSTGMSTEDEIKRSVELLGQDNLVLLHCTSTYPCHPSELNLRMINTLRNQYECPIGYSGHEVGLQTTLAAVTLGACFIERHITLDRTMWGSDHAASVEPQGIRRLVRDIRTIEAAMGDGIKKVYDKELEVMNRLRITNISLE